jgi:hypothetical protein
MVTVASATSRMVLGCFVEPWTSFVCKQSGIDMWQIRANAECDLRMILLWAFDNTEKSVEEWS